MKYFNKALFWLPFGLLFTLLGLSFYCQPAAEDLAINYFNSKLGFWEYLNSFYRTESSRYFSFPLTFILFKGNFFLSNYYIIPILLISTLWIGIYALICSLFELIGLSLKVDKKSWLATLILITLSAIAFEPSTLYYWISGSVTYLPGFILFLFLFTMWVRLFLRAERRTVHWILASLLVICITGSNEISLYFLFLFLVFANWIGFLIHKKIDYLFFWLLFLQLACIVLLILQGGSSFRANGFSQMRPLTSCFVYSTAYCFRSFFQVISSPMCWAIFVIFWSLGTKVKTNLHLGFLKQRFGPLKVFLILFFIVFLFYFTIYFISGELLPPRANNLISIFILLSLLLFTFFWSAARPEFLLFESKQFKRLFRVFLILIIISNSFFQLAVKNVITGLVYFKVNQKREKIFNEAKSSHVGFVRVPAYEEMAKNEISKIIPSSLVRIFSEKMISYPEIIHYRDPLYDSSFGIYYYLHLIGLDSLDNGFKIYTK